MLNGKLKSRGDTLIEVLFAVTIFSLVAVGGISIMNQGTAAAQRSLEITLVRQQIDSQAETLRFLNASFVSAYKPGVTFSPDTPSGQWQLMQTSIINSGLKTASDFGSKNGVCSAPPAGSFILDTSSAKFVKLTPDKFSNAVTFAQVRYGGGTLVGSEGLWIEGIRADTVSSNDQSNAGFIDFHVRACWDSLGQTVPMTTGTIVRLYEPRG